MFSDKGSTFNKTALNNVFKSWETPHLKPNVAATIIQKIWRGYQTRKLLENLIN